MSTESKSEIIHAIGVWTLRVVLLIGAVALGCFDKTEAAGACVTALVLSFIFLES